MCAGAIVIGLKLFQDAKEVVLVQDDCVIQTLSLDRPNDALGKTVLPWRMVCGPGVFDAHSPKSFPENGSEDGIIITNEILAAVIPWKGLAELLRGPMGGWVRRGGDMPPGPGVMIDNDHGIELLETKGGDSEEVGY